MMVFEKNCRLLTEILTPYINKYGTDQGSVETTFRSALGARPRLNFVHGVLDKENHTDK